MASLGVGHCSPPAIAVQTFRGVRAVPKQCQTACFGTDDTVMSALLRSVTLGPDSQLGTTPSEECSTTFAVRTTLILEGDGLGVVQAQVVGRGQLEIKSVSRLS
jgi:hypothetical protein